ncbi:MAG: hypothetical protein AABY74_11215, partial [Planctomycetota bacterium]
KRCLYKINGCWYNLCRIIDVVLAMAGLLGRLNLLSRLPCLNRLGMGAIGEIYNTFYLRQ